MATVAPQPIQNSTQEKARRKWKLLQNTFRAIILLRTHETRTMYDVDDLIEEIKSSPCKEPIKRNPSLTAESIDEHKMREKLFSYIKTSTREDIEKIKEIIENNPRRYSISPTSPDSLLNKAFNSSRPVYEAAKLGYAETVSLLLGYGANPHLKSGQSVKETSLEVACRWRHQAVVDVLLEMSDWSSLELKRAMKNTSEGIFVKLKERVSEEEGCKCVSW